MVIVIRTVHRDCSPDMSQQGRLKMKWHQSSAKVFASAEDISLPGFSTCINAFVEMKGPQCLNVYKSLNVTCRARETLPRFVEPHGRWMFTSIHKNVCQGGPFLSTLENATGHQSPKCQDHKPPVPVDPGKVMRILFPSQTRQQMTMCFDLLTIGVGSG